jgi:hypothetical protein
VYNEQIRVFSFGDLELVRRVEIRCMIVRLERRRRQISRKTMAWDCRWPIRSLILGAQASTPAILGSWRLSHSAISYPEANARQALTRGSGCDEKGANRAKVSPDRGWAGRRRGSLASGLPFQRRVRRCAPPDDATIHTIRSDHDD